MIEKKHAHIVTNMALADAVTPADTFHHHRQQEGAIADYRP